MPFSTSINPSEWYGRLQRAYMADGDESMLEDVADIGRLMAVTGFAVEGVLDVHGAVLMEELAGRDGGASQAAVQAATVCLSELLVAWRVAAESIGGLDAANVPDQATPVFLRFDPLGHLLNVNELPQGEELGLARALQVDTLEQLASVLGLQHRRADLRAAIAMRRIVSLEFPLPDVPECTLRAVVCPFRDGSGILGIHDISARRAAAEAEFQRRKLESLGQLAGGVAHEINNLLQPILSTAQFVIEDHGDNAALAGDMGLMLDCARAAAEVVRGVLAFSRRAPASLVPLSLAEAAAKELAAIRPGLPPTVSLSLDLSGCGDGMVAGNRGELGQVLRNLVGNAVDAVAGCGTVVVSASRHEIGEAEAVRLMVPAGGYFRLSVADDGPGIDAATASRIFDPFFTTKDIGKGTGLGLAIVRSIVQSWGGSITLRRDGLGGATFDILLPAITQAVPDAAEVAARPAIATGAKVMVVDDDAPVRLALVRGLARAGYQAQGCGSGTEALACLAGVVPDVLVTDLFMPEMDGFTFIKAVRQQAPKLPVIVLTGGGKGAVDADHALSQVAALGVHKLLVKPVSTDMLLDAVAACLPGLSSGDTLVLYRSVGMPSVRQGKDTP